MKYSKIQKFIASIIIPFFFFWMVFNFPANIFNISNAWDSKLYSLVSILVNENIYNDVSNSLETYAEDISRQLENTKVIIIPTPNNAKSFNIASLNENLFYEWYKWINKNADFKSKLVWTILIWDFPLPVVYKNKQYSTTILPYIDFENKSYIYNHKTKKYQENNSNLDWIKPEIWHWIISPNTWDDLENIKQINNFFEKDHNFYQWTWNFKKQNWIINWKINEKNPDNYEPYVFYFDQIREQKAVSYSKYIWYQAYLENKEALNYNRFDKKLADNVQKDVLDFPQNEIKTLLWQIPNNNIDLDDAETADITKSSDIMTKAIIDKATKDFVEVINSSKIWEFRKNVNNAWRYSLWWKKVNVDMIPHIISILDKIWDKSIKWAEKVIEDKIDNLVMSGWLSRYIAIPITIDEIPEKANVWRVDYSCHKQYTNILYWKTASEILLAEECSIYRWSNKNEWILVKANRWINIYNLWTDSSLCTDWKTNWYWWGNSPLNLDDIWKNKWDLKLKSSNYKLAIRPLFDISGSKKVSNNSLIHSPLDCFSNNYIFSKRFKNKYSPSLCEEFILPINWIKNTESHNCDTVNQNFIFSKSFSENYKQHKLKKDCTPRKMYLDSGYGLDFVTRWKRPYDLEKDCKWSDRKYSYVYNYKTIPSYIKHISPTKEELSGQIIAKVSPNLPIDVDRYIDFIWASGKKDRIDYPNFFRIEEEISEQDSFKTQLEKTSLILDELLLEKTNDITKAINNNNPASLNWIELEIYHNWLKISEYPSEILDLKEYLKNKESVTINILWENKKLSYYDNVVFSLFWNNLKTVWQKYKFVFENYLSDQTSSEFNHYLPKNKKVYEIAYLWAPWNASNMYIGVNPEEKGENPYSSIEEKNALIDAEIFSFSVQWSKSWNTWWYESWIWTTEFDKTKIETKEALFKCAPPEWVSIFEWPSAIACRIKNLSFEINFDSSRCSSETLFEDNEEKIENLASEISDMKNNWNQTNSNWTNSNWTNSTENNWDQTNWENKEKNETCRNDLNKNWVEDCIEKDLQNAKIELISSSKKVYTNSYIWLEARILNPNWKILNRINNLKTSFELVRIVDKKTNKIVAKKDYQKYINFRTTVIPTKKWHSKHSLNSNNKLADYYFKVIWKLEDSNKDKILNINSNTIKVEVRKDLFSSTIDKISNDNSLEWDNTILASDQKNIYIIDKNLTSFDKKIDLIKSNSKSSEKLIISLAHYSWWNKQISLNYPLKLSLTRNWKKIINDLNITKQNLSNFFPAYSLTKKWEYKLKITNAYWETTTKNFNIIPNIASNIDIHLATNILEKDWNITSNIFILKDKYWNISSWFNYNVFLESKWNFLFPINNWWAIRNKDLKVFEWYKWFRLKATNKNWVWKLNFIIKNNNKILFKKSQTIQTIEKINTEIKKPELIKVWWNIYQFEIDFKDNVWNILKNLNSRVYLSIDPNYWTTKKPYFSIIKWKAIIDFKTKNLSWKDIPIELKLEGLREIIKESITINADSPIKLDLNISKDIAKASPNEKISIKIQLKDRYNNTVFSDNSTKLKFQIKDKYNNIIKLNSNLIQTITEWEATFNLKATSNPWTAYYKISTIPDLSINNFEINWKKINWVWEKSGKIQTYYFWDKESFKNRKYNSLYTVMLWADYWNIKEKDYLAGSILFNKNNRSLAVTSLVNNPYKFSDLISIYNNWRVEDISSSNDLTQDLELTTSINKDSKLFINIYNKILNREVWKINYLFWKNTKTWICETTISECNIDKTKNSIYLKSLNKNFKINQEWRSLFLEYNNKNILEINRKWELITNKLLKFQIDNESKENFLIVKVKFWNESIATLIINVSNEDIEVELPNSTYNIRNIYLNWKLTKNIYYNNFLTSSDKVSNFSQKRIDDIENFRKKWGLWWKWENKFLLDFAAGKKVWESIMDKQSFWIITLWDPVISLKPIKIKLKDKVTERSFNSTIWKKISKDTNIKYYSVFDYDNDNKDDILLIKDDWYLKLLENKIHSKNFLNKWNLAYIIDHWNKKFVKTWDFTWDWYDDIFFINNKWIPGILNNFEKDFKRIKLEKQIQLEWKIVQVEVYDMDNDWKTDIITLDESWEINIFYGWGAFEKPVFTQKKVGSGSWLKLDSSPRKSWALISFSWIYNPTDLPNNSNWIVDEWFLNRQIFVKVITWWNKNTWLNNKQNFIKSEYSNSAWIEVKKIFKDINWWTLKSWDIVEVEVIIKNISNSIKRNISYLDKVEKPFTQEKDKIEISKWKIKKAPAWYQYLINNFTLVPWAENKIKYKLKTPSLSYWNIKVWLFEKGEIWDDIYWDIIVKKDNKNCSDNSKIYKSIAKRRYGNLTNKELECDSNKMKLPTEIEEAKKITTDNDKNWIPDYIDELKNNPEKAKEYAKSELDKFNNEEIDDSNKDKDLTSLDKINEKVDEYVEDLENLIEWFACGFGGWSCISTPLNWAPLAPWNDPTLFWVPVWDWLKVEEWIPIFSSFSIWKPHVWPPNKAWAGWYFWTTSPINTFRLFVTPTLTWWVWTAICYGWPASVVWRSNPPLISPLVPGWNCIVAAKPLLWCSNDGSEWDPESMWQADNFWWNNWKWWNWWAWNWANNPFWVINWNCWPTQNKNEWKTISDELINKYYNAKANWLSLPTSFKTDYKDALEWFNDSFDWNLEQPLFELNWEWVWEQELNIELDPSNLIDWNFEDVIQIQQDRVSPFPSFLMDWVTRQIEEVITKLSDFPTIFIIIPDFSWIIDTDWGEYSQKIWDEYSKAVEKETSSNEKVNKQIEKLEKDKKWLNCNKEVIKCSNIWYKIWILESQKIGNFWKAQNSWIKTALEFLSNVPIIELEPQQININIPWPDTGTLDKFIVDSKATLKQWKSEVNLWKINWSANSNLHNLISNLEQNIEIAEEYKQFPKKLTKLLNQKEIRINQVMCSLESISEITGWWIWRNGKRFKAWVETYILIKAILKSWQQLIDIFTGYEAECHECKNERQDLLQFEFKLISMILPKFPVIQFPKWPDLILDLHNIRASINIKIPDVVINQRPLVLPNIPELTLPEINANIELDIPEMPLLPRFEFPELPDLPTLPEIKLPDLPPPPQLPKIFSELEWVLKILELITKAMCLLKQLPFVPEWRAWDQIAFLTERNWYLPTDFIDLSLPQFSVPYLDAIKVTTYVNLETDSTFLVETLRNIIEPLNTTTNNWANKFNNSWFNNLDFSNKSININKTIDLKNKDKKTSFNNKIIKKINTLYSYLNENKNTKVNSHDFLTLVNKSLASSIITNNSRADELKNTWKEVNNYNYSKENKLIIDLQKSNYEKFETLNKILTNELRKNSKLKKDLKNFSNKNLFQQISSTTNNKDFIEYKKSLEIYNNKFLKSASNLIKWTPDKQVKEIREEWNKLLSRVKWGLKEFNSSTLNNKLLSATSISWSNKRNSKNSCQEANNSPYHYNYKWLYIVEKNKIYRLFNYMDELTWDETYSPIDFDNDWDLDLLYFVNWELYLKENLNVIKNKDIIKESPIILKVSDNKYFNWDDFVEAINWFKEINTDNWFLNIIFKSPTDKTTNHFIVSYYTIVDKFLNKDKIDNINKNIIDAFVEEDNILYKDYLIKKHSAYINYIWDIPAVRLDTAEMENIWKSIQNNNKVNISATTPIYTASNSAKIKYYIWNKANLIKELEIEKHSSTRFKEKITIISINWNVYLKWKKNITLIWSKIKEYIWLPLLEDSELSKISNLKSKMNKDLSNIEIKYNWWFKKNLNFSNINSYKYYNLWTVTNNYLIRTPVISDYYYWKIYAIKKDIEWTYSSQKLFAPQIAADTIAPELDWLSSIRIPVYQKKEINLKHYIYENSWINSIKNISIQLKENSNILSKNFKIEKSNYSILLKFNKFDKLFKEKINLELEDMNWNKSITPIDFEIYSPKPEINNNNGNKITWKINEELYKEPINIYRIRSWMIKRLETNDNKIKVYTDKKWKFDFDAKSETSSWLILKENNIEIVSINENTWKITLKNHNFKIKVNSNNSLFPEINIIDINWNKIYSQFIKLSKNIDTIKVDNFDNVDENWLYFKMINPNYESYNIPNWAKHSAWVSVIYKKNDNSKKEIFIMFPDWRIKYSNRYYISYKSYWENIILELKTLVWNKKIAEVLYNINWTYLMK